MDSTRSIKEILLNLPSNYFRATKKYKFLSPAQAAEQNDGQTLSVKTVNKYLDNIKALFRSAVKHSYMEQNHADGLKISIRTRANKERLPFDQKEFLTLFYSPGYTEDNFDQAWKYWLPILGSHTGCRFEQLC